MYFNVALRLIFQNRVTYSTTVLYDTDKIELLVVVSERDEL